MSFDEFLWTLSATGSDLTVTQARVLTLLDNGITESDYEAWKCYVSGVGGGKGQLAISDSVCQIISQVECKQACRVYSKSTEIVLAVMCDEII